MCPDASTANVGETEAQVLGILSGVGEIQESECNESRIDDTQLWTAEIPCLRVEVEQLKARVTA